jgi:hypothetical protein
MQWLVDDQERGFRDVGADPDQIFSDQDLRHRRLNLMAIENCLCEISKYLKAHHGTGRPRNRYMGARTQEEQNMIASRFKVAHPIQRKEPKENRSKMKAGIKKKKKSPVRRVSAKKPAQMRKKSPKRKAEKVTKPRVAKRPMNLKRKRRARSGNRRVSRKRRK